MPEAAPRAPARSRKLLRHGLYAVAALTLLVAAVATYLAATFDPNDYRQRVIDLVRDKTGRTLEIRGDIGLSFWPDVAVRLEALSLTERESSARFASVERARVRLEIAPLLKREIVASELLIDGARVALTRDADGRLNIDDLLAGGGETPRFDIARLAVTRSAITFRDLASGRQYDVTNLHLETDRLTAAAESPLALAFELRDAAGALAVHAKLIGRLGIDLAQKRYAILGAALELAGRAGSMTDAKLRARGDVTADLASAKVTLAPFELALEGIRNETEHVSVNAAAAEVVHVAGEAIGREVHASLAAQGRAGTTDVKIVLPAVARRADAIAAEAASVAIRLVRGEHVLEAHATAPLEANIAARELALKDLRAELTLSGPHISRGGIRGAVKGDLRLDSDPEGVQLRLAGRVDESNVKAQLAAAGFAAPVYTFAVDIDRLDLDRYLRGDKAPVRERTGATPAESLLAPLSDLPASGTLTVGVLSGAGAKANNVKVVLK